MGRKRSRAQSWKRCILSVEELESRLVPTGSSYTIPLDPTLDQFGDQIETIQAYGDPSNVTFGIFDTGASAVTFSADDQSFYLSLPIPVKVPGGAFAGGIGGDIVGDVSQPGTIYADGLHAMNMTFDQYGYPYFNISLGSSTATTPGIQAFLGTASGSPDLPTITGTPILNKSTSNPNGLAAVIDMQGATLDFSSLIPGLTLTMPDISFAAPGAAPTVTAGATTAPFYVSVGTYGDNNYTNPGDLITESPSPFQTHVGLINGTTTLANGHFLLDTGAQLTVISTSEAQQLGLDLAHPDSTIDVSGVGGTETVPGFTISELDLPTTGGGTLHFTNVPIYVLDVAPDVDGLLGMNLFNTAASVVYDPYTSRDAGDPTAGSLGLTFYTDPNRGLSQLGSTNANLLRSLGLSFIGAVNGHSIPGFSTVSVATSTVSIVPSSIQAGGSATITLTARDASGNLETHGGLSVAFGLSSGSGTFSAVTDNHNGTYSATFTGTSAGNSTISATINGRALTSPMPSISVTPGPVSLSRSTISVAPASLSAGGSATVTLTAKDSFGNRETSGGANVAFGLGAGSAGGTFSAVTDHGDGTYSASFMATTAGSNTITATINGQPLTSAPPSIMVTPGPVNLSKSSISVAAGSIQVGGMTTVTVIARDALGNQQTSGGAIVAFGLGTGTGGGTFSAGTDHGDGTYSATFSATSAGSITITATINSQAITSTSASITVTQSSVSLSNSTISIAIAVIQAGSTAMVTLIAKDGAGNQESSGGATVVFGLGTGNGSGSFSAVTDHGDGTYSAMFTATSAGSNTITAGINSQQVTSILPTFTVPPGPGGMIATDVPIFTWAGVAGADHYDLWVDDRTAGHPQVLRIPNVTGTSLALITSQALTPGHTYMWWAGAVSSTGFTNWGPAKVFSIAALPAPTISSPGVSSATDTPTLSWTAVTGAASYTLWLRDWNTGQVAVLPGGTGTSLTLTAAQALTPGHTYLWWVAAVSTNGQGLTWSAGGSFTIAALAAPSPIGSGGTILTDMPTFQWTAVTGAASYELWISDQTTGKVLLIPNAAGTSVTLSAAQALTPGHFYRWWVATVSINGLAIIWSVGQSVYITALPAATPTGPSGTITTAMPTFSWTAAPGAASYELWVSDQTTGQNPVLLIPNISALSVTLTASQALTPGHKYRWWIAAVSTNGLGASWSAAVNFALTTLAAPTPAGPSGTITTDVPVFSWTAVTGAAHYDLWVDDQTTGTSQVVRNRNITGVSWTPVKPLTPGHKYRWWVAAVSTNGLAVSWSGTQTFMIAAV
jgi:hypothetical protein